MGQRRPRHLETGFTLIELLIVVAIIAILAAILVPNLMRARRQAVVAATKSNLHNIATVLEEYFVDGDGYPAALAVLVPTYTRQLPVRPGSGGAYAYQTDGASLPQNYVICDNTTDTITNAPSVTTWYWVPPSGMGSVVAASVNVGFATCP
jgi:prepilin-type N-terminal cleavage/methylation domain-containing protein